MLVVLILFGVAFLHSRHCSMSVRSLWIVSSLFGAFQSDWGREKVGERLAGIEEVFEGSRPT